MISKSQQLTQMDLQKICKGAIIAGVGALCTFILENLGQLDFGQYTVFVSGAISVLFNAVLKYINETKY